jgi:hypothetical protein
MPLGTTPQSTPADLRAALAVTPGLGPVPALCIPLPSGWPCRSRPCGGDRVLGIAHLGRNDR